MHGFELIVFDLDGTLVDSQTDIIAAMETAFAVNEVAVPDPDAVRRVVGLSLDRAIADLLPADTHPERVARIADTYKQAFTELKTRHGHSEQLFPGARETLAALDTGDVCLAIATGKSRKGLISTLDRHGLAGHFVSLQTADDAPGKPHPRMLDLAIADVGASADATVLVGDTSYDMAMAHAAGAVPLGVAWGYHGRDELTQAGAARLVESFHDIPAALAELRPCGG